MMLAQRYLLTATPNPAYGSHIAMIIAINGSINAIFQ